MFRSENVLFQGSWEKETNDKWVVFFFGDHCSLPAVWLTGTAATAISSSEKWSLLLIAF